MKYKSNKIVTAVLAILLVVVIAGAAALVGVLSNGFKDWTKFQPDEQTEQTDETADNGGAIIGESVGNGVKLMSAKIPVAEYAANGVSAQAETAYTLTATITPNDASNKAVNWSVAFVNPSSSWANGKKVTDYVTVTPVANSVLTATVECKQAFGEQIKVTVTSVDNPEKSASCTVDYAQKVTGASLSFGDVNCVSGGDTAVTFEVASGVQGQGGAANFDYESSSVYTLADTFAVEYEIVFHFNPQLTYFFSALDFEVDDFVSDVKSGEHIYFDVSFFDSYLTGTLVSGAVIGVGSESSPSWILIGGDNSVNFVYEIFNFIDETGGECFSIDITVSVEGTYSDFTYTTTLSARDFVNNSTITDVSLNESNIIF